MNRSYYAIIPANVRYDKELKPNAKLLYGEITALANEKGYCWATNGYFAELYGVSPETISRWVSQLNKKGYVKVEIIRNEYNKQIEERRIYIANYPIDEKVNTPCQKSQDPLSKKSRPLDEKVKDNITVNSKNNNICAISQEIWSLYPKKKGKIDAMKKIPNILKETSKEELTRCIDRYKSEFKNGDYTYMVNGSTFFNGRYADYLDENYIVEIPKENKPVSNNSKSMQDIINKLKGELI